MKKIIASILAVFFIMLSPISAYAATTESMMTYSSGAGSDEYAVMPLDLYDNNETLQFRGYFSLGDYDLDKYTIHQSESDMFTVPTNERFDNVFYWPNVQVDNDDFINDNINSIRYTINITNLSSDYLFNTVLGIDSVFSGLGFGFALYNWGTDNPNLFEYPFYSKPRKIEYKCYTVDDSLVYSGFINNNDIDLVSVNSISFPLIKESTLNITKEISRVKFTIYYDLPKIDYTSYDFSHVVATFSFRNNNENFVYGDYLFSEDTGSSPSQDDYNKNVEAELGNIQTGINNVVNSVMQMGQQAWQGAQQTVQAVTQMTQQLNTAIDQQRQDILEGLGLLGDDIDSSMNNVKTEITNMSTSISNKLESTTESITNKIESTTETITSTIENKVDQVTTAVDNVKQSVTEVKQSILDLPNKIKDMLLGLIVPDSHTMADKYSEFSGLLEEKLGVIYQIPMMLFDFFDTIVNAATTPQSTLTLPAFRLPWIDGSQLTIWNSMEYKIIPDGLEVLSDLIRTVTSMTVVVLTFNSVKQAYERFLRS